MWEPNRVCYFKRLLNEKTFQTTYSDIPLTLVLPIVNNVYITQEMRQLLGSYCDPCSQINSKQKTVTGFLSGFFYIVYMDKSNEGLLRKGVLFTQESDPCTLEE